MKQFIGFFLGILISSNAYADGFKCLTAEGDLFIQVYNHLQPSQGTRKSAMMIISDPTVHVGNQVIAKFTSENSTLDQEGASYSARVDLRYTESRTKGEYISGTRLGFVKNIVLDIDFSYSSPVKKGTLVPASLLIEKRNGENIERNLVCSRYLKN